jgi:hypothetical protein
MGVMRIPTPAVAGEVKSLGKVLIKDLVIEILQDIM